MRLTIAQAKALGLAIPPPKRRQTALPQAESHLEAEFAQQLATENIGGYVREYQFDEIRGWAFDFCWVERRIAVEVDGRGHNKDNRYYADIEKCNHAALQGWLVLHCTTAMIDDLSGLALVKRALQHS